MVVTTGEADYIGGEGRRIGKTVGIVTPSEELPVRTGQSAHQLKCEPGEESKKTHA
jgi:hypothetical protein